MGSHAMTIRPPDWALEAAAIQPQNVVLWLRGTRIESGIANFRWVASVLLVTIDEVAPMGLLAVSRHPA